MAEDTNVKRERRTGARTTFPLPDNKRRQEIRAFSKLFPDRKPTRTETARQILSERKAISHVRDNIDTLETQANTAGTRMIDTASSIENLTTDLEHINDILQERSTSLLKRTLSFFGSESTKKLNERARQDAQSLAETRDAQAQAKQEYDKLTRELTELTQQKAQLQDGTKALSEFYRIQEWYLRRTEDYRALFRYRKEHGFIENFTREHNIYFVHATHPGIPKGQDNAFLKQFTNWQDKVAVVSEYHPTVSASTITPGETTKTWAPIGVILKGGIVEEAAAGDMATIAHGLKVRRSSSSGADTIEEYRRNIARAVSKDRNDYNELIIGGNVQIAGIFINMDSWEVRMDNHGFEENEVYQQTRFSVGNVNEFGVHIRSSEMTFAEVFEGAENFGMEVFVFEKGTAYNATCDAQGRVIKGKEVTPEEMLSVEYQIPERNKYRIQEQAKRSLTPAALVP